MFGKKSTKLILVGLMVDRLVGMHVEVKGDRLHVIDYLPILDTSKCFRDGVLFDYDLLTDLLVYEVEKLSIKTRDVVLGVWLKSSESKLVSLVRMDDKELASYIDLEYSKAFSGRDKDRFVFDYERVGSAVYNGDMMDAINIVSVSKDDINGILTSFHQRKLNVLCVDDLCNSMKYVFKSTLDNLFVTWITSNSTFMMYYDRGDVLYTRKLDFGYGNIGDFGSMYELSDDQVGVVQQIFTGILESSDYIKSYFKVSDLKAFSVTDRGVAWIDDTLFDGIDMVRLDREGVLDGSKFVSVDGKCMLYDMIFSLGRRFIK